MAKAWSMGMKSWGARAMMALILPAVLLATGCHTLARVRTLPPSVRTIHIPMVINQSGEIGLEERFTVAMQEEFLADGRLEPVQERLADATVHVTIRDFKRLQSYLDDDDFPTGSLYVVETHIEIRENAPGRPLIGEPRKIETEFGSNADTRSGGFITEYDRHRLLAREWARAVVLEVITGEHTEEEDLKRVKDEDQDRRGGLDLPSF